MLLLWWSPRRYNNLAGMLRAGFAREEDGSPAEHCHKQPAKNPSAWSYPPAGPQGKAKRD